MTRTQLEHILRASAAITGADQFVIIGSQAILAQHPNAPSELLNSIEADIFTTRSTNDALLIDGSIGEGSPFHNTFGYYAHGVSVETAVLPTGWSDRLVALNSPNTGGATGLCLEAHDLSISKLVAGRPKDLEFVDVLVRHGLVQSDQLWKRLAQTSLQDRVREATSARLERIISARPPLD